MAKEIKLLITNTSIGTPTEVGLSSKVILQLALQNKNRAHYIQRWYGREHLHKGSFRKKNVTKFRHQHGCCQERINSFSRFACIFISLPNSLKLVEFNSIQFNSLTFLKWTRSKLKNAKITSEEQEEQEERIYVNIQCYHRCYQRKEEFRKTQVCSFLC